MSNQQDRRVLLQAFAKSAEVPTIVDSPIAGIRKLAAAVEPVASSFNSDVLDTLAAQIEKAAGGAADGQDPAAGAKSTSAGPGPADGQNADAGAKTAPGAPDTGEYSAPEGAGAGILGAADDAADDAAAGAADAEGGMGKYDIAGLLKMLSGKLGSGLDTVGGKSMSGLGSVLGGLGWGGAEDKLQGWAEDPEGSTLRQGVGGGVGIGGTMLLSWILRKILGGGESSGIMRSAGLRYNKIIKEAGPDPKVPKDDKKPDPAAKPEVKDAPKDWDTVPSAGPGSKPERSFDVAGAPEAIAEVKNLKDVQGEEISRGPGENNRDIFKAVLSAATQGLNKQNPESPVQARMGLPPVFRDTPPLAGPEETGGVMQWRKEPKGMTPPKRSPELSTALGQIAALKSKDKPPMPGFGGAPAQDNRSALLEQLKGLGATTPLVPGLEDNMAPPAQELLNKGRTPAQ